MIRTTSVTVISASLEHWFNVISSETWLTFSLWVAMSRNQKCVVHHLTQLCSFVYVTEIKHAVDVAINTLNSEHWGELSMASVFVWMYICV